MAQLSINVGPNQRLSEYAVRVVARRTERLAYWVEKASRSTSEKAVHQIRVAARRLGSGLEAFSEHFPSAGAARVARKAKHLRKAAGAARDRDISLALAAEVGLELSENAIAHIEKGRRQASDDLRRRLERFAGRSPGAEWSRALRLRRSIAPGPTAASYAGALLPEAADKYFAAGHAAAAPEASIESLHEFRLLGKRFRYTLEIFAPCYGEELRNALQLLCGLQDILGMINDCETAAVILKDAVGRGQRKRVQELLDQRQAALIENFRSHWQDTFAAEDERQAWKQMLTKPAFAPTSETAAAQEHAAAS